MLESRVVLLTEKAVEVFRSYFAMYIQPTESIAAKDNIHGSAVLNMCVTQAEEH